MAKYFAGLDFGTGSGKMCVINENADVIAYAFREFPILTARPGWSEHDPALYWSYTREMVRECVTKAGIDSRDIKAIAISAASPGLVMIDRAGNPINMAYNLMDRRAVKETRAIGELIGKDRLFRVTGNRIEDHPALVNLMWEKNNRPNDYARIYKALTADGYIRFKLTGEATFHYSAGFGYGVAYDMRKKTFDQDILRRLDIDESILPRPTRSDEIIGEVTMEGAACGLAPGTQVAGGQLDCNASWLGAGAIREGDVQMNLGTVGNFGVIHRDTDFIDGMIVASYTIDSEDAYITIPTTTTGGQALRYIRDHFCQAERGIEQVLPIDAYDMLNMQAEKAPPGSDGLVVLPYLMGERTPLWDANARGVVFGLSLMHTKGHVVRAAMEGVAYALYRSFEIIKNSGKKINSPIILNEGGAKSGLWRRIITDVFGTPTAMCKNRMGAPYGDAILAAVAHGAFPDFSITREKAEYVHPFEPDGRTHARYQEYYKLFRSIYEHVKEDYTELARLRELG